MGYGLYLSALIKPETGPTVVLPDVVEGLYNDSLPDAWNLRHEGGGT